MSLSDTAATKKLQSCVKFIEYTCTTQNGRMTKTYISALFMIILGVLNLCNCTIPHELIGPT